MTQRQWMQKGYFRNTVKQWKLEVRKRFSNMLLSSVNKLYIEVLYLVVLAIMTISIGLNFAPLIDTSFLKDNYPWIANNLPEKPFQHLPAMAISTGALIALLTYSRNQKQSRAEFLFKQASHGLDEVYELLKDKNNDRIIWVRAARSLLQAQKVAKEIELVEYKAAYRLYELRIRNDLYLALTVKNPHTGNRQSLPPHFFFGLPDWREDAANEVSLDEVAKKASQPIEAYTVDINRVPPEPQLYPLSEKSVIAVFDFLDYPKDFVETLDDVEDWSPNMYAHTFHYEKGGAARYIAHRQTK